MNKFKCFDIFEDPVCFSLEEIVKIVCKKENIGDFKENSAFSGQDKDSIRLALDMFFNYDSLLMKIVVEEFVEKPQKKVNQLN